VSIVNKEEIVKNARCDSEYFSPEYIALYSNLLRINSEQLCKVADVTDGNHLSIAEEFVEKGVRYLRGQDVIEFFIDDSNPIFIPESVYLKLKRSHVKNNDILLSIVGTIGNIALATDREERLTANCKLAIIRSKTIEPEYLFIYLASKYGQAQIRRNIRGTVQKGLILPDLKKVFVISADRKTVEAIRKLVHDAYIQRIDSVQILQKAENLFLEKSGIENAKFTQSLSYQKSLSELRKANRMDAEYFQPFYEKLLKTLSSKSELRSLERLAQRRITKIKPDPEKTYKYIEIGDVSTDVGEVHYTERLGKELPPNARVPIRGGELIISKVRPTRGAIGIIPKEFNKDAICSSAFSVFEASSPWKEYIYVVMRSVVGKLQMKKPTTGTSYPTIDDVDVERVQIPIPPDDVLKEFVPLVNHCYEARAKSKGLIVEAIETLEKAIETNNKIELLP